LGSYGVECDVWGVMVWSVMFGELFLVARTMHTTVHVVQTDRQTDGGVAAENNPGLLQTTRVGRS